MKKFLSLVMVLTIIMITCACGVSAENSKSEFPWEIRTIHLPKLEEGETYREYVSKLEELEPENGNISREDQYGTYKCVGFVENQKDGKKISFDIYMYVEDGIPGVMIRNSFKEEISFYGYLLNDIGVTDVYLNKPGESGVSIVVSPQWAHPEFKGYRVVNKL